MPGRLERLLADLQQIEALNASIAERDGLIVRCIDLIDNGGYPELADFGADRDVQLARIEDSLRLASNSPRDAFAAAARMIANRRSALRAGA